MQKNNRTGEGLGILSSFIQRVVDLLYIPMVSRYISQRQFRYFCCGVGNYILFDGLLYFMIYHYLVAERYIYIGIATISPHVAALAIVFPITFFTGFLLNRYVVFESTSRKFKFQIARYAVSVMGSILLNYAIIKILVEWVGMWATPSKIICSIITAVYSFFMARCFAFTVVKEK